jgi:hypothetical protein
MHISMIMKRYLRKKRDIDVQAGDTSASAIYKYPGLGSSPFSGPTEDLKGHINVSVLVLNRVSNPL